MAKVTLGNLPPGAFPSSRGSFYTRMTRWGAVVQKWPRPRSRKKKPGDVYRDGFFGVAARYTSNVIGEEMAAAIEFTAGTEMVPRDALMCATYGLLHQIQLEDGTKLVPYAMVSPNAQFILDQISNTPGVMLWRSPNGWIAIPPGSGGQLLTIVNSQPSWQGAGIGAARPLLTTLRSNTSQSAASANNFVCTWDQVIVDENNVWDAGNPTRLNIPSDAELVRLSFTGKMTSGNLSRNWRMATISDAGTYSFGYSAMTTWSSQTLTPGDHLASAIGGWAAPGSVVYVTLQCNVGSAAVTSRFEFPTQITLEAIYPPA